MITQRGVRGGVARGAPGEDDIDPPQPDSDQPYFSTWLTQQLVDRYGAGRGVRRRAQGQDDARPRAPGGRRAGDPGPARRRSVQAPRWWRSRTRPARSRRWSAAPTSTSAVQPRHQRPPPAGLGVQAVHADRRARRRRQPGADVRVAAEGVPGARAPRRQEKFVVNNYEDQYSGVASLRDRDGATRTTPSTPSSGLKVGHQEDRAARRRMGIETEVSTNPAMTLGGLTEGVTPLELAYAYSTIANKRRARVRLAGVVGGRAGRDREGRGRGTTTMREQAAARQRVFSERRRRRRRQELLAGVVSVGTGKARADRRVRRRQDRHHRELRRRMVRGLQQRADGRRVGRLSRRAAADGDRVPGRPGRRRHLPGRDLARLHGGVDRHPRPARGRAREAATRTTSRRTCRPIPACRDAGRARPDGGNEAEDGPAEPAREPQQPPRAGAGP